MKPKRPSKKRKVATAGRSVRKDGRIEWKDKDGKLHREDGAAFEWPEKGAKAWYIRGRLHREDGPAMDGPLGKGWYRNGKRHRDDGPAIEWADGRREWYRRGKRLTEAEFDALRKKELAAIGDAFVTGLDHKITVFRAKPPKTARKQPRD